MEILDNWLGCYQCGHTWQMRTINPSKQCPHCLSRKWNNYEHKPESKFLSLSNHNLLIIKKEPFGRRTPVRYTMDVIVPKDDDYWIQMFDVIFKCIKCGKIVFTFTDDDQLVKYPETERDIIINLKKTILTLCTKGNQAD